MFFSTELLARRDSGYGLLWLAATLGSKSKKLARREVVSADITRLCTLVSQPPEPLALRLSSNLMVGVARVYKIKHDIFENDVSNCVMSLRKSLSELYATDKGGIDMVQVIPRPETINMQIDPAMSLAIDIDGLIDDWDTICRNVSEDEILPDNFSFLSSLNADKSDVVSHKSSDIKKLHKLDESFEHLFSSSFLQSLGGGLDEPSLSSAHVNDVLFNLDLDEPIGLGEEMEKDLEEAWNLPLRQDAETRSVNPKNKRQRQGSVNGITETVDPLNPFDEEQGYAFPEGEAMDVIQPGDGDDPFRTGISPMRTMLANQMEHVHMDEDQVEQTEGAIIEKPLKPLKGKPKRFKVLIDTTTELSDEQLKANRVNYYEEMKRQKAKAEGQRVERDRKRRFEEELWNPPSFFQANELLWLWNERVANPIRQQDALWKEGLEDIAKGRPKKRRQISKDKNANDVPPAKPGADVALIQEDLDAIMPPDAYDEMQVDALPLDLPFSSGSRRSSQDLGQPRHASHPPSLQSSLLGRSGFNASQGEFLSNNIFPWDNAGNSSVVDMRLGLANGSDSHISVEGSIVRLRKGSGSIGSSPTVIFNDVLLPDIKSDSGMNLRDNDEQLIGETQEESDNVVTLERNSFNFLGYARMHATTTPGQLFFSDIVPVESSSARVAAEGFYHCLALATKNLVHLTQTEAYGPIRIQIV